MRLHIFGPADNDLLTSAAVVALALDEGELPT